ncbi:MAG: hypothetical protein D6737_07085 [Chloroflexi bacterium]|nr:MAG: hypothetical protein D6737_07085 [Chloroflexota bacterium]
MEQISHADRRFLLGLKFALLIVSASLLVHLFFIRGPEVWPLTRLSVYATNIKGPGSSASEIELRIVDTQGNIHRLFPNDLYTTLGSANGTGTLVINRAFQEASNEAESIANQEIYRIHLIDRVKTALPGIEPAEIQFWRLRWQDFDATDFPPFEYEQPDEEILLGQFETAYYADGLQPPDRDPDYDFGDSLALLGFGLPNGTQVAQCEDLYVRSWWSAVETPAKDYHITIVLADETGIGRAQSDSTIADDLPTTWPPGHEALDRRFVPIPCDLETGNYNLLVGLYDFDTVENLPVTYPDGSPHGSLAYLTTIEVIAGGES